MRNARSVLTQRSQFLCLHQAILGRSQFFQRFRQFARAFLHTFKQANIFDCNRRLVGKGRDELDLFVGKRRTAFRVNDRTPIGTLSRSIGTPRPVRNSR